MVPVESHSHTRDAILEGWLKKNVSSTPADVSSCHPPMKTTATRQLQAEHEG